MIRALERLAVGDEVEKPTADNHAPIVATTEWVDGVGLRIKSKNAT